MMRVVLVSLLVVLAWVAAMAAVRALSGKAIDWKGLAFMAGFVALAFWLRHKTGIA